MLPDPYAEARSFLSRNPAETIRMLTGSNLASDPEAQFLRGVAFFRLGDFVSAEDAFRVAISMDATRAEAFYYLGLSLERRGLNPDAVKAYRVALALDPGLKQARDKLRQFGSLPDTQGPVPPAPQRRALDSELMLPDEDAEFADYERRKRRKAAIDARAEYEGQWSVWGMPRLAKGITVVFFIVLLAFFGFVLYNLVTGGDMRDQQRQLQEQACELAEEQGVDLPGC